MSDRQCPACGAPAPGRFCSQCGAAVGSPPARSVPSPIWWAAGGFVVVASIALVWTARRERASSPAQAAIVAPFPGSGGEGAPPDLSTMAPRERFDRLYRRVMRAAESGDTATTARFAPMAILAYGQLDTVDADARYHVAVLQLHVRGDTAAALRLADTVLAANPRHLFGFLIRGTVARLAGDARLLDGAYDGFLAAWDAEIKAARPEYRDHRPMLDQFHAAALAARTGRKDARTQ